ncbi:MAG: orotidine-5'-phosphate decarboxylase [Candidatus Spechtbacteria bacterium]|nr:orotidine-5'-phosphate decarboxylase [Candidatus Spechtbacteria bacterium]
MKAISFMQALEQKREEKKWVSVGLDTDYDEISPEVVEFLRKHYNLAPYFARGPVTFAFNRAIIEATCDIAACYKINPEFYAASGLQGFWALERTAEYLWSMHPNVPWIFDRKYGDVGHANEASVRYCFGILKAPAVTVNPLVGRDGGLDAFLWHKNKGVFVWCQSSNKGALDFQDPERLSLRVVLKVHHDWNALGNCGLVVGAKNPARMGEIRKWAKGLPFLVPGVGEQGGDLKEAVKASLYRNFDTGEITLPALFNSSRGIIFASHGEDFAEMARAKVIELNSAIGKILEE